MKSKTITAAEKYEAAEERNDWIESKIERALQLKDTMDKAKAEFDEIKDFFLEYLDKETTEQKLATQAGTVTRKITNSYSVKPEMLPQLAKIFKDNLPTFVEEKKSYGVTTALRKLLADADYKHSAVVREAVLIKQTPSVTFEPVIRKVK